MKISLARLRELAHVPGEPWKDEIDRNDLLALIDLAEATLELTEARAELERFQRMPFDELPIAEEAIALDRGDPDFYPTLHRITEGFWGPKRDRVKSAEDARDLALTRIER